MLAASLGGAVFACTAEAPKKRAEPIQTTDDLNPDEPYAPDENISLEPDEAENGASAFGPVSERPRKPTTVVPVDAGATRTYCGPSVVPGDLAIVELMVSSKAGANDTGEWVEVQSTRTCWLKVDGVSVESPRGKTGTNRATITDGFELAPRGTFVAVNNLAAAQAQALPGKLIAWDSDDVLKNDGDTVTVNLGAIELDRVTYPQFSNVSPGRSLSFPADCAWTDRASWTRWSLTYGLFGGGLKGTPNTPNDDVTCF